MQAPGSGFPSVEAEAELVEIVARMLLGDRALMCPEPPSFEQPWDPMYVRPQDVGWIWRSGQDCNTTVEALGRQAPYPFQPSARTTLPGSTTSVTKPNRLPAETSGKSVTVWPYHCAAKLVEPSPCGFVALQPEHPLNPQCTRAVFLARDFPDRKEPMPQGLASILEQSAGRKGGLPAAPGAQPQSSLHLPGGTARPASRTNEPVRPPHPL